MKNLKLRKFFGVLNAMALMVVMQTANAACVWVFHQPEFPEAANKFKKVQ